MKKKLISFFVCALTSVYVMAGADGKNVRTVKLTGQEVKVDKENRHNYLWFILGDNVISLQGGGDEGLCAHKFSSTEWKKAYAELAIGKNDGTNRQLYAYGPNNSLLRLDTHAKTNGAWEKLTIVPNTQSIEALNDSSSWKRYDVSELPEFICGSGYFTMTPDSMILVVGTTYSSRKHILMLVDFKNNKFIPLDYWPDDGNNDTSEFAKSLVYMRNCTVLGNGKGHYLYKHYSERLAFIFTIVNDKVKILKSLYTDYPTYRCDDGFTPMEEYCNIGVECTANNNLIAMLLTDSDLNGARLPDKREDFYPYKFGNILELYDWDGNKQNVIYLDHYGNRMKMSDDGKKLYLFASDNINNVHKIWFYDLSNLDKLPQVDVEEMEKARALNGTAPTSIQVSSTESADVVKEGDMMADFELYDYNDNPHHLNEFLGKGKYTFLEFSSLGCGPCQMIKPYLAKLYLKYKDLFEMITISSDRVREWKDSPLKRVPWHEWNDHNKALDITEKYNATGEPYFVLIDSDGKVLKKGVAFGAFLDALKVFIPAEEIEKTIK